MIIKTYCMDICLEDYEFIDFDYDKSMLEFTDGAGLCLYFRHQRFAMDFYSELIEAIHENSEEIDLSHYPVIYSSLPLVYAKDVISERIRNHKSDEND